MATLGKGDMCIFYKDGENLDDVMRITEKDNVPNDELMIVLDSNGKEITLDMVNESLMKYYTIDGEIINREDLIFKSNNNNDDVVVISNPYIGSRFSIKELDNFDYLLDDSELNHIKLDDKIKKRNKRKSLIIFKYKKFLEKNH